MVPDAEFRSYYGLPILNRPVWAATDIAGYLFLGGLAGASSVVAAGASLTGRGRLARAMKLGSAGAISLSLVALVHDLGRPARFANMLRTFKPTSPMNVGSWLLSAFGTASAIAALSDMTALAPAVGSAATAGAAVLGPAVATYTAALIANTAVPAWRDARRELPWLFASSAATAAAGLGLVAAPLGETAPVRRLGTIAGTLELVTEQMMERRMGLAAETYRSGTPRRFRTAARALLAAGVAGSLVGRRNRVLSALAGALLLAGSALTRFAVFHAGVASTADPRYTVVPQRRRLSEQGR
jgi:hypothetical protein